MILATRAGQHEVRAFSQSLSSPPPRGGGSYGAGVRVDPDTVAGLPAVDAVLTSASQALACLTLAVWRGEQTERTRVRGSWQARLLGQPRPNPAQTWFEFWETVERSMTARRNAFVWRTVADGRVVALWALHPDQVWVELHGPLRFRVAVGGLWLDPTGGDHDHTRFIEATDTDVWHVKGPGGGGRRVAPSPVDVFRSTFGASLAQTQYQEGFYRRGVGGGLVLSFPLELNRAQAEAAREMWEASAAGVLNAHGTRVVSGGATVTPVTVSQRDAQFVESAQMGIDDICRIMQWETSLVGGGAGIGQRGGPISPEHELTRMVRYRLLPRMMRWEAEFRGDPWLFGDGTKDYPQFDREGLIRADVATQTAADAQNVQTGILLVDEVRAARGLPPLPDGIGQIPQVVPVGGSPAGVPMGTPVPEPLTP